MPNLFGGQNTQEVLPHQIHPCCEAQAGRAAPLPQPGPRGRGMKGQRHQSPEVHSALGWPKRRYDPRQPSCAGLSPQTLFDLQLSPKTKRANP